MLMPPPLSKCPLLFLFLFVMFSFSSNDQEIPGGVSKGSYGMLIFFPVTQESTDTTKLPATSAALSAISVTSSMLLDSSQILLHLPMEQLSFDQDGLLYIEGTHKGYIGQFIRKS